MGTHEFKLPDIGEGVVEGEIVAWHVNVGDIVKEDDPIMDVMTDKATVSIPSPVDGEVISISGEAGDTIAVGNVCIVFSASGEDDTADSPEVANEEVPEKVEEKKIEAVSPGKRVLASPAVRKMARESGLELSDIRGTGPAGRVSKEDIEAHMSSEPVSAESPAEVVADIEEVKTIEQQVSKKSGTTEIPVIGLRRKIADQMSKSKTNIPHFSYFEEVDVTNLEELRQHMNSNRDSNQPKIS